MITNVKIRIAIWFSISVIISLYVASCMGGPIPVGAPVANVVPTTPGPAVVRIGWKGGPDTMNPGMSFLTDAYTIFNLVYDTMYELNLDNTFRLSLAESVQTSTDGKTWTYKIHPGIKWQDGQPLTAHDIAFTYNFYHTQADFPYLPAYTQHFAKVAAPF